MDAIWIGALSVLVGGILGYGYGYHRGAQMVLRQWREALAWERKLRADG